MGLPFPDLHAIAPRQDVWRGDELGGAGTRVQASGHVALDAQLPGGGWPLGAMTEVLQATPEAPVWQLLLPALAQAVRAQGGPVVLIGAPCEPFGPVLAAGGLPDRALLWVRDAPAHPSGAAAQAGHMGNMGDMGHMDAAAPRGGTDGARLWACEQALRCAEVAAVLAWLPRVRVSELRRLQMAAARHEGLLFVFRPEAAAAAASPARLRLRVAAGAGVAGPVSGQMDVQLLKRRGPPLAEPLRLPAYGERLAALLAAGQWRRGQRRLRSAAALAEAAATAGATVVQLGDLRGKEPGHALDRPALAA